MVCGWRRDEELGHPQQLGSRLRGAAGRRRGARGGRSAFGGPAPWAKELILAGVGIRTCSCRVFFQQTHEEK